MQSLWLRIVTIGVVLVVSAPAMAIDDFDKGKSPPELFRSDCGICHHNPQRVGTSLDARALAGYLAVHYTASREIAGLIANYLATLHNNEKKPRQPDRASPRKRSNAKDRKPAAATGSDWPFSFLR